MKPFYEEIALYLVDDCISVVRYAMAGRWQETVRFNQSEPGLGSLKDYLARHHGHLTSVVLYIDDRYFFVRRVEYDDLVHHSDMQDTVRRAVGIGSGRYLFDVHRINVRGDIAVFAVSAELAQHLSEMCNAVGYTLEGLSAFGAVEGFSRRPLIDISPIDTSFVSSNTRVQFVDGADVLYRPDPQQAPAQLPEQPEPRAAAAPEPQGSDTAQSEVQGDAGQLQQDTDLHAAPAAETVVSDPLHPEMRVSADDETPEAEASVPVTVLPEEGEADGAALDTEQLHDQGAGKTPDAAAFPGLPEDNALAPVAMLSEAETLPDPFPYRTPEPVWPTDENAPAPAPEPDWLAEAGAAVAARQAETPEFSEAPTLVLPRNVPDPFVDSSSAEEEVEEPRPDPHAEAVRVALPAEPVAVERDRAAADLGELGQALFGVSDAPSPRRVSVPVFLDDRISTGLYPLIKDGLIDFLVPSGGSAVSPQLLPSAFETKPLSRLEPFFELHDRSGGGALEVFVILSAANPSSQFDVYRSLNALFEYRDLLEHVYVFSVTEHLRLGWGKRGMQVPAWTKKKMVFGP